MHAASQKATPAQSRSPANLSGRPMWPPAPNPTRAPTPGRPYGGKETAWSTAFTRSSIDRNSADRGSSNFLANRHCDRIRLA